MPRDIVTLAADMSVCIEGESCAVVMGAAALILLDILDKTPGALDDPTYGKLAVDLRGLVVAVDEAVDWATLHLRLRGLN